MHAGSTPAALAVGSYRNLFLVRSVWYRTRSLSQLQNTGRTWWIRCMYVAVCVAMLPTIIDTRHVVSTRPELRPNFCNNVGEPQSEPDNVITSIIGWFSGRKLIPVREGLSPCPLKILLYYSLKIICNKTIRRWRSKTSPVTTELPLIFIAVSCDCVKPCLI